MHLLYPIGLLALAGLIVPVIIHLWSVKQGKTLKIGSIVLLGESASATSKSFKITDWLLFILRCVLLILVALILTQPFVKKTVNASSHRGWILMEQGQLATVYSAHRQTIDSLLNLGYELHHFGMGFKQFQIKDTLGSVIDSPHLSYNSLLKQLNAQLPNGYAAFLFAPKNLAHFNGDLPGISYQLTWKDMPLKDTLTTWSTQFLNKTYEGRSTPNLTSYTAGTRQDIPALSVLIYEPVGNDSKYISAALAAIEDFTGRKIKVQSWTSAISPAADIVFWLTEKQMSSAELANLKPGAKVFAYEQGKAMIVNSTLRLIAASSGASTIALYKRMPTSWVRGMVIWKDGFGQPLLVNEKKNGISYYHFFSRFNPQYTDLVWNEQFVNALLPIALGHQDALTFGFEKPITDQRRLAINQKIDLYQGKTGTTALPTKNEALTHLIWVLALLTLLVERILSFRKTNISYVKN